MFRVQINVNVPRMPARRNLNMLRPTVGNGAAQSKPEPVRKTAKEKIGRNDPCWCGSGKKYKHCHYKLDKQGVSTSN